MLYHHVDIVCFFDEGDRGIQDIKNTVEMLWTSYDISWIPAWVGANLTDHMWCGVFLSIEFRMGYDCGDFEDYKPAPWNHKKKKGADDNIIVFGLSW